MRVLVTGFGAFPGAPFNPTQAIVARLAAQRGRFARLGVQLETAVLPVVYEGARERVAHLLSAPAPDIVLHLGLAARRRTLSVETRARNRLPALTRDAAGRCAASLTIEREGPPARPARANAPALVATLGAHGAPARLSIDAGDYLCNLTLWHTLALHEGAATVIHIPRPRRLRAPAGRGGRTPTLATMTQAIAAAIMTMSARARRRT